MARPVSKLHFPIDIAPLPTAFLNTPTSTGCSLLDLCLVLLQVPKCFVPVQIFCVVPKIYLHIVPVTNILCQNKRWFAFSKIGFCAGTRVFEEALNAVKFLDWLKKFGPAENILGPVKGQGIRLLSYIFWSFTGNFGTISDLKIEIYLVDISNLLELLKLTKYAQFFFGKHNVFYQK